MSEMPMEVCDPHSPQALSFSECIAEADGDDSSPIDEFDSVLKALNRSLGRNVEDLGSHPQQDVMQSLVVSAVSATELYFRRILTDLIDVCPLTAGRLADEKVSFGALRSYGRGAAGLSLLDGVLFSSQGTVARQLKRVAQYEVKGDAELQAAIANFEIVCQVRHLSVHFNGYVDSRAYPLAVGTLGLGRAPTLRLALDIATVQKCFAVCDHLVRYSNQRLFSLTCNRWLDAGLLTDELDDEPGLSSTGREALKSLVIAFRSAGHVRDVDVAVNHLAAKLGSVGAEAADIEGEDFS